jgi:hypothetical protein
MRITFTRFTFLVSLGLLGLAACSSGSGGGGGADSCGKPGRTGVTDDGCGQCAAGQYCDESDFLTCKPGCTSDANCGETEQCIRCGSAAVGTCQSCSRTEADVCGGGSGGGCTRDTFWDMDCVSPGKAYTCPSNMEPSAALGTCSQASLSTVWCCGGAAQNSCMRDATTDMPNCIGDPTHSKSYDCVPPDQPTGDCVDGMIPGMFCCAQ